MIHPWPATPAEAEIIQRQLVQRHRVEVPPPLTPETLIAGCDLAYAKDSDACFASVVVARDFGETIVETADIAGTATFPYVPGLLSFREVPLLLGAFARLSVTPDLVVCDGQGRAHPRGFGLACHLGLWLDRPTVGCAKSRLIGRHPPLPEAPGHAPLVHDGVAIGAVVRRIRGVKPLYVSVGHRCDLPTAIDAVQRGTGAYRIPEPLRAADLRSYALRRGDLDVGSTLS